MAQENPYAAPSFVTESPLIRCSMADGKSGMPRQRLAKSLSTHLTSGSRTYCYSHGATVVVFAIVFGFGVLKASLTRYSKVASNVPRPASTIVSFVLSLASNILQAFIGIGNLHSCWHCFVDNRLPLVCFFGRGERLLLTIGVADPFGWWQLPSASCYFTHHSRNHRNPVLLACVLRGH